MTGSAVVTAESGGAEMNSKSAVRDVTGSAAARMGPTGDRYHRAMERYLAAIGSSRDGPAVQGVHYPIWRLRDHHVSDVMTCDVVSVTADTGFKEVVDTIADAGVSALPVVDGERKVIGVISVSDLMAKVVRDRHAILHPGQARRCEAETARDVMTVPAITTSRSTSVIDAARTAAKAKVRQMPVVDAEGKMVGVVTRSDLIRVFLHTDQEIRQHVVDDVLVRHFGIDPSTLRISVEAGIVTVTGQVERRLLIGPIVDMIRQIAGVVAVHNQLTYTIDDTILPPSRVYY